MTDFIRGGVTEDEHLNQRRDEERDAGAPIAQHLDELLDHHLVDAPEHVLHANRLWNARVASSTSSSANTASAASSVYR